MKLKILLLIIVISLTEITTIYSQSTNTISGQVKSKISSESIIGAYIYTKDYKHGTVTDEFGRFSLKINQKYNELIISNIGYLNDTISINSNHFFEILLEFNFLPEVIIKSNDHLEKQIGRLRVTTNELQRLPSLFGEVDVLKSLIMLPGVTNSVEGSSGLIVRGGNASQNLVLLDGVPIYNPAHLFGFVSIFNSQSIKFVELIKGGFPSQYGGRLSSILNVNMKDGNLKKRRSEFTIGLINSSIFTEGPLIKDKLSYMVSGRLTNFGIILFPSYIAYKTKASDTYYTYTIPDFNVKLNYKINNKQGITLGYYNGADYIKTLTNDDDTKTKAKVKWGNHLLSLRYHNMLKNNLFLNIGVYLNQYNFTQGIQIENSVLKQKYNFVNDSRVQDLALKAKLNWVHTSFNSSILGIEINNKKFSPYNPTMSLIDSIGNILNKFQYDENLYSNNISIFVDHNINFSRKLKFVIGGRYSRYKQNSYKFNKFEPRSSFIYKINKNSVLKITYDRMSQPIHLLSSSDRGVPNEIWVPSTEKLPSSTSNQIGIGYSADIPSIKSKVSFELYYKQMKNIIRLKNSSEFLFSTDIKWRDNIIKDGIGKSFGFEFLLKKEIGKFNGYISYTLSKSYSRFNKFNNAKWFPSNFNRIHELELTASYPINKKWLFSSNFIFQSGRPITLPDAIIKDLYGNYSFYYSKINGYRTLPYHRLDISFSKSYTTKKGRKAKWSFGIYNLYGHTNPFYYDLVLNEDEDSNRIDFNIKKVSLLNFVPSINYSIKF